MEGLDLAIDDDVLHMKTSRTVTFTLSSSSSSSSSSSLSSLRLQQDDNQENGRTSRASYETKISENRILIHSQSMTLECQRRRPVIEDPYQVTPNLQILDDWMITTTGKSRQQLSEVHGFSEEQIAVYEESFSLLDKDGDGNISNHEIRCLMNSLGYAPSEEDISSVISKVDINGDGSVDFHEFLTMMRRRKSTGESDTELQQVFNVFDKNKDGFIDKDELYDMLLRLGENITDEDVTEMIEEADCFDNDGKVSYEEFKAILHSK
ncbi:unnamed protein product [Rotaria sp. Silwood2]|nr:unnamed protein product [Rotaria sp. Silwood2]CAF3160708.1 unnamed protein product [Rotaria sp. Silwood2]CAF4001662.1 unnamed protein product [Rotaria sp. Silwood2]CAF4292756.1 unnamed protein product [Rotaria sp. Silwood2]